MSPFLAAAFFALVAVSTASDDSIHFPTDCVSKSESGVCRGNFPRFFFNQETGSCEKFSYGGCGGNDNNYGSQDECESTCKPAKKVDCTAEPSVGLCRGVFAKFFFNKHTGKCHQFFYGGCGGNTNNFDTEEECTQQCGETKVELVNCNEEAVVGRCKAAIPAYHFNAQSGQCEEFIYGGCGGNTNRFSTHESCRATCATKTQTNFKTSEAKKVDCTAEPSVGLCQAAFRKFFFNKHTGKCHQFIYGGCGGNTNNFNTEEECTQQCGQTQVELVNCNEEAEVGLCRAAIPVYYFNAKSGQCEEFIYGGCGGNTNKFATHESCHATCATKTQTNYQTKVAPEWTYRNCVLPAEVGRCLALIPRFHFNSRTGSCDKFMYGGCGGNANNFATEKDCTDHCLTL